MKLPLCLGGVLMLAAIAGNASEVVIRNDGTRIVLHENGTWERAADDKSAAEHIAIANSGYGVFHFAYDRNRWTVEQHPLSDTVEFILRHQNGSANVKIVTERVTTSLDGLRELNLDLIRKNDPNGKIVRESPLTVNGNKGLLVDTVSQAFGSTWRSRRYLWSGKQGSVQIICTDSESNFEESSADFNSLINGFTTTGASKG